jgi:hypothetical protein
MGMEPVEHRSLIREAEAVVRRLRGISAVRVDLGEGGAIDRVHVLGSAERTPRVVVADVIAALASELGVSIDPGQIRVATLRPGQQEPGPAPTRGRLKFVGLTLSMLRTTCEAKVQLEFEGSTYEGVASGPNAAAHRLELVAGATLRAVEIHLRSRSLFLLEGASIVPVTSHQVAVVVVSWLGPSGPGEELLSGASLVRDDPRESVVRATLAAINRPVGWLSGH